MTTSAIDAASTGPSPRQESATATFGGKIVLFGGVDGAGYLGDTWTWSSGAWKLAAAGGPSPRAYGAMGSR